MSSKCVWTFKGIHKVSKVYIWINQCKNGLSKGHIDLHGMYRPTIQVSLVVEMSKGNQFPTVLFTF